MPFNFLWCLMSDTRSQLLMRTVPLRYVHNVIWLDFNRTYTHLAVETFTCYTNKPQRNSLINPLSLWVTHICVSKVTIIGTDNGLSPGRRQAIIWANARWVFIEPLGANFSEILIEILTFSFKKMRLKVSSAKWRTFCLGRNVLIYTGCWLSLLVMYWLLCLGCCFYF